MIVNHDRETARSPQRQVLAGVGRGKQGQSCDFRLLLITDHRGTSELPLYTMLLLPHYSQTTSSGILSARNPRQLGWRSRSSDVRSL